MASRSVQGLDPRDQAIQKGIESEQRVEEALLELIRLREIFTYYKSDYKGELDRRGVDFQVYPESDWSVDLQVKSSKAGKDAHLQKYGYSIACIIVHEAMDDRQLLEELRRVLSISIANITNRH